MQFYDVIPELYANSGQLVCKLLGKTSRVYACNVLRRAVTLASLCHIKTAFCISIYVQYDTSKNELHHDVL
jgi:hypothetical protein